MRAERLTRCRRRKRRGTSPSRLRLSFLFCLVKRSRPVSRSIKATRDPQFATEFGTGI